MVSLAPLAVHACPNCYAASDVHVLHTYYFSAFMLTLLPFAIVGTLLMVGRSLRRPAPRHDHPAQSPTTGAPTLP